MDSLEGRVAVVTGGGGGIGAAMGARFAEEGMRVVLADVVAGALDATVEALRSRGHDVTGVVTDVSRYESVEALRDQALETYGAVHVVCNNAGIGAGAEGPMWDHEINDWAWSMAVNVWGVIHGIKAFVPAMLAAGDEGHVVNTASNNGGIAPLLPISAQYAVTKAAVVTMTECLYAQLLAAGARVGASVLFPGPNLLRTGLFDSWRSRPDEFARLAPRKAEPITFAEYEAMVAASGRELEYTPLEEVAGRVVDAVRSGDFWILPPSERFDEQIRDRADSMTKRENPAYLTPK